MNLKMAYNRKNTSQDYTVVEGINYGMSYFTPEKRFIYFK